MQYQKHLQIYEKPNKSNGPRSRQNEPEALLKISSDTKIHTAKDHHEDLRKVGERNLANKYFRNRIKGR